MKNSLKENWFKVLFLIIVLLLLPIYFKIDREHKTSENLRKEKVAYILKQTARCENLIIDLKKSQKEEGTYTSSVHGYNPKYDYCVYSSMTFFGGGYGAAYVKNLFTNEDIAWVMTGQDTTESNRSDFRQKQERYLDGIK